LHGRVLLVSFETSGSTVMVKREKICDGCKVIPFPVSKENPGALIMDLINDLTADEFRTILINLSLRWAEMQAGGGGK